MRMLSSLKRPEQQWPVKPQYKAKINQFFSDVQHRCRSRMIDYSKLVDTTIPALEAYLGDRGVSLGQSPEGIHARWMCEWDGGYIKRHQTFQTTEVWLRYNGAEWILRGARRRKHSERYYNRKVEIPGGERKKSLLDHAKKLGYDADAVDHIEAALLMHQLE